MTATLQLRVVRNKQKGRTAVRPSMLGYEWGVFYSSTSAITNSVIFSSL